jgi:hypothetical protein
MANARRSYTREFELAARRGLGDERPNDEPVGGRCVGEGGSVPLAQGKAAGALGSRQSVRQ